MLIWGGELVLRTWNHTIPSLGIPRGLAYASLPISGTLIAIFALEKLIENPDANETKNEDDPRWN
jgi:TRAP-type C4-dicarboxylate transport system permease small subunit